jgi:hypothetical protein
MCGWCSGEQRYTAVGACDASKCLQPQQLGVTQVEVGSFMLCCVIPATVLIL